MKALEEPLAALLEVFTLQEQTKLKKAVAFIAVKAQADACAIWVDFMQTCDGRYQFESSSYEYNLTDHLSYVRVSVDESGNVLQRDDYYPFGLTFNSWHVAPENKYKFQGQEHQEELGWDSFKWRSHDPALGRFFNKGNGGTYIYYRCSKKKHKCSQGYVGEDKMLAQLREVVQMLILPKSWLEKMNNRVSERERHEQKNLVSFGVQLETQIEGTETKLDKLVNGFLDGLIDKESYLKRKTN